MSNLRVGTLSNIAGTGSPDIVGGELCRARFNLNGIGTIAANDSFNVSSFLDNGLGDYTANWQVAFPNGSYSFGFGGQDSSTMSIMCGKIGVSPSANAFRFATANASLNPADVLIATATTFGDKP
ncbi:hypothetical protein FG93_01086 [Bosea sp. LC85]|uniref:hypothetical protein n=1 Tax=Bosea sp. LC85 TaxID=1502851 RepID=UPI0004E3816A|nr:hypothetical protein [Bosea sp. LC85]KFC74500.1 hypothetical protein FG93_01086 [Bosea sp. LC85]